MRHRSTMRHRRRISYKALTQALGAQFRALCLRPPTIPWLRLRPSSGALTATLVVGGFLAAATALVGATAAAPGHNVTATADRSAAAARADRADRPAESPAGTAPPTPTPAAPAAVAPARVLDWVSPMPGTPLSSCYGSRWGAVHLGIDFAGAAGADIHAAGAGTVFGAGWLYSGYGMSVVIDHGNGLLTHYAHMSQVLVSEGQQVVVGEVVGLEGSTGDSTGPHLHFEVHQGLWNQVDPAPWLREHGVPAAC